MKHERLARLLVFGLISALLLGIALARIHSLGQAVEVHASMPESGGWAPADLATIAGKPLHLRLTSDDVLHGFALGQSDQPAVDVIPGQVTELTLSFDQPGKYTYYCTRWCGPNHWRMRGTIEVLPDPNESRDKMEVEASLPEEPLYVRLGLNLDAERHTGLLPDRRPNAALARAFDLELPEIYQTEDYYRTHTPAETWQALRKAVITQELSDQQTWDLVARSWRANTSEVELAVGRQLYAENCAACHGEQGAGDGVMAEAVRQEYRAASMHGQSGPTDFTDAQRMLAASPAILHGKIVRGGMGTGMPYWGPVLTDEQIWSLVAYLWTFQFDY